MRKSIPWIAVAVAIQMFLMAAPSSFAVTQDEQQPSHAQTQAPSDQQAQVGDEPEQDVTISIGLDDQSQPAQSGDPAQSTQTAGPDDGTPAPASDPTIISRVKDIAVKYVGTPYRWGGTTPAAFDCSGFTRYILNVMGVHLPRTARDQFKVGTPVKMGDLQPGDLVFFDMMKGYVSHVGLYIGDGMFIHASTPIKGVRIDRIGTRTYKKCFVGARRYHCA